MLHCNDTSYSDFLSKWCYRNDYDWDLCKGVRQRTQRNVKLVEVHQKDDVSKNIKQKR